MYYDRIFQNPLQPTYFGLRDDLQRFSTTWNFGQAGAPVFPQTFPSIELPPNAPLNVRNVFLIPDEFAIPVSYQFVATVEHAFRDDFSVSFSVLHTRSYNKELLFDRNLSFDDATQRWLRPDPLFRSISQYSFTGKAEYTGIVIEATKRLRGKLMFGGNFTYSRAYDQGDNFSSSPVDMRFPENEWGPQADTPRARRRPERDLCSDTPDPAGGHLSRQHWRRIRPSLRADVRPQRRRPVQRSRDRFRAQLVLETPRAYCRRTRDVEHPGPRERRACR